MIPSGAMRKFLARFSLLITRNPLDGKKTLLHEEKIFSFRSIIRAAENFCHSMNFSSANRDDKRRKKQIEVLSFSKTAFCLSLAKERLRREENWMSFRFSSLRGLNFLIRKTWSEVHFRQKDAHASESPVSLLNNWKALVNFSRPPLVKKMLKAN